MISFPLRELYTSPSYTEAAGFSESGVKAIYYDSIDWKGKKVKVFAWLGIPEHKKGEKVPGIVLVHGGGGTAFADWVRLWTSRGYAAIAMDTCGGTPIPGEKSKCLNPWPRHENSGPHGWDESFFRSAHAPEEQWPLHAVAAVIKGHSLLRSLDDVDSEKTGISGISWGGVLTCISAGIDSRFRFAAPVYGCGHLHIPSLLRNPKTTSIEQHKEWLRLWDPSLYLKNAEMPFLWTSGTNDFAFPIEALMNSMKDIRTEKESFLSLQVRMVHGHSEGENPGEILNFADHILGRKTTEIPVFGKPAIENGKVYISLENAGEVKKTEFNFTRASGFWMDRFWNIQTAFFNGKELIVEIPEHCKVFYVNACCAKDLIYSSVPVIL